MRTWRKSRNMRGIMLMATEQTQTWHQTFVEPEQWCMVGVRPGKEPECCDSFRRQGLRCYWPNYYVFGYSKPRRAPWSALSLGDARLSVHAVAVPRPVLERGRALVWCRASHPQLFRRSVGAAQRGHPSDPQDRGRAEYASTAKKPAQFQDRRQSAVQRRPVD